MSEINWSVFTPEETQQIKDLLVLGQRESIVCIITDMTYEKEVEVQKIMDGTRPLVPNDDSEVRKEYYKQHPNGPETPAEEAELQAKLDEEVKAEQERQRKLSEERMAKLNKSDLKLPEVKESAKKFCESCDSKGVRHLKNCPTLINK